METEQQMYEVPGRQLGWRVSQLQAQGIPYDVQSLGGGVYIVTVQQPVGAEPFAYAEYQRRRRPRLTIDRAAILRWAAVLGAVAVVAVMLWFTFGPSDQVSAETGGMRLDPATGHGIADDVWSWLPELPALRLPWQAEPQQPSQQGGFRWPWDAAADAVADVQATVTMVLVVIVTVLVLMIVLVVVRKRR